MISKGIRGAITVEENTIPALKSATIELLTSMILENDITQNKISHVIFTTTKDINIEFPAKFARVVLGWENVAMMCFHELEVPQTIEKCLRVLMVVNCKDDFEPKFVYLKGAKDLRNK